MLYKHAQLIIKILLIVVILPLLMIQVTRLIFTGETFYPTKISSVLINPYMGWAPSAEGGPYEQPHKLVYMITSWRELEPQKGQYALDILEQKYNLNYWENKDIKIIMRITMDSPGPEKHMDIPGWLYKEIGEDGTWYDTDYGKGFSPNYNNPKLISYHQRLIAALGRHYNNRKIITVIALGSIGHWGEWHTKQDPAISIPFPAAEISDQYVQHYLDAFPGKFLIMRRPYSIARENNMGLYNDSFGDMEQTYDFHLTNIVNGYHDYLSGASQPPMPDYWKHAPAGGEIATPPGMSIFSDREIKNTLKQIQDCHISWLGPSCPAYQPPGTDKQNNYDLTLKTMGYRFILHLVKHPQRVAAGESLPVEMVWGNEGAAPFYYPWPLELSLTGSKGHIAHKTTLPEDIRTWQPGKKTINYVMDIPPDLKQGKYNLCVAILNPDTGEPSINLAIGDRRPDGRYQLDQIIVSQSGHFH